jgi:hypothetical protein
MYFGFIQQKYVNRTGFEELVVHNKSFEDIVIELNRVLDRRAQEEYFAEEGELMNVRRAFLRNSRVTIWYLGPSAHHLVSEITA